MGQLMNSFIAYPDTGPSTPSLVLFGYDPIDFDKQNGGTGGQWSAFDGDIDEAQTACAISDASGGFVEFAFDWSWAFPAGKILDFFEIWGSNDNGYISGANPSDLVIGIYGWNGSSYDFLGDTGTFTDGTVANKKTISSSDNSTLYTKGKVRLTWTGAQTARIAELKFFEFGAGQILVPNLNGKDITPGIDTNALFGLAVEVVRGIDHKLTTNSLASLGANTDDLVVPFVLDIARPIQFIDLFSTSDHGFLWSSNPTDMQIDLEIWTGSSWDNKGTTGTFTDSNNLKKTITCTDQVTPFDLLRIRISTATAQRKLLSKANINVLV